MYPVCFYIWNSSLEPQLSHCIRKPVLALTPSVLPHLSYIRRLAFPSSLFPSVLELCRPACSWQRSLCIHLRMPFVLLLHFLLAFSLFRLEYLLPATYLLFALVLVYSRNNFAITYCLRCIQVGHDLFPAILKQTIIIMDFTWEPDWDLTQLLSVIYDISSFLMHSLVLRRDISRINAMTDSFAVYFSTRSHWGLVRSALLVNDLSKTVLVFTTTQYAQRSTKWTIRP